MPDKKVDHYFFTGERYIAVYEDGTSEPVPEENVVNDYSNTPVWMDEVVVTADRKENRAEQPNWFQNAWQNGDAQKNEQARQSWNKWMPRNFTDYSNPDLFKQLGDTSSGSATPKVLQSKAIEPKFDWQDMSGFSYPAYDGPDYNRDARMRKMILEKSILSMKKPILIAKQGNIESGEGIQSGNTRNKRPVTNSGRYWYNKFHLNTRSNQDLLTMMFKNFPPFGFSSALERKFRENTGGTFIYTNNDGLPLGVSFYKLKGSVQNGIERNILSAPEYWYRNMNNTLDFSYLQPFTDNPLYAIPIGGIQKVQVHLDNYKINSYMPKILLANGNTKPGYMEYDAMLTITIMDNFGVDERDFAVTDFATILDRLGLASFWELQHNRGYKPLTVMLVNKNVRIKGKIILN